MGARGAIAGWSVLSLLLAGCASRQAPHEGARLGPPLRSIVVTHPLEHWSKEHFVEMAPTVRVSVAAGGEAVTRVYLRLPDGAKITLRTAVGHAPRSLMFPPGTESDRVSYVRDTSGTKRFIDDVRGTRWDEHGTEYFHVYLPSDAREGSELVGVEWRRDDAAQERAATDWLVAWGRTHRSPDDGRTMDEDQADRFRSLNHCQSCHVADKPEATSDDDPMPPWPTDARGLYVPLAVFTPRALLSTSSSFDDPNVDDPFVNVHCARGNARLHGGPGYHWLTCADGMPVGERDLVAAMKARDEYAARTCNARRYLFTHMDDAARAQLEPLVRMCP